MVAEMPIGFDPAKIETLEEARGMLRRFLNLFEELSEKVNQLLKENQELKQEVARLKKQSSPPRFPQTKKHASATEAIQQQTEKKRWKKAEKKGTIAVDREVSLPEVEACVCGGKQFRILRTWKKMVQGIQIFRDNVIYKGLDKRCIQCGKVYVSEIPEDIKGRSFSPETASTASLLKYFCRMSEGLIYTFFTGFGLKISRGEITTLLLGNSNKLIPAYTHLRVWGIKLSRYIHTDATGSKRYSVKKGATGSSINQHMQIVCHKLLSIFSVTRRYNSESVNAVVTKRGRKLVVIGDDGSPNRNKLLAKYKQLCWIHEIRHYLKLFPRFHIHKKVLAAVLGQWWELYWLAKAYGEQPTERKRREIEKGFDVLIGQTTGYEAVDACLQRTARKRERLLTFLNHPGIPIENNQAERDLRAAVIIRKISGATKSAAGDRSLERHLSIIHTARKQGLNVHQTLHGLLTGQLSPFVLTAKRLA